MDSKLFTLSLPDWLKALLVAVIGSALTSLEVSLSAGGFASIHWSAIILAGVTAGISYLIKNFFTSSNGVAFGIEATKNTK